jgi:hypothetical protein
MAEDADREATKARLLAMAADYESRAGLESELTEPAPGESDEPTPAEAPTINIGPKITAGLNETLVVRRRPVGRPRREWRGKPKCDRTMSIARNFIAALQQEQRIGNVSSETEQHLKHEFRKLGGDASHTMLAAAVNAEIDRLERQAATLRLLQEGLLGVS